MSAAPPLVMRTATAADLDLLSAVLLDTANWDGKHALTVEEIRADPKTWRYLEGWQRPSDFGLVLMDGPTPVGAVWARYFTRADPGYGYVSDAIPELTLAVAASRRHSGFGQRLLEAIIRSAGERGLPGLSLSVEDGNTAARALYTKLGFAVVGRNGGADTMLLPLSAKPIRPRKWIGPFGGWIILAVMLGFWLIDLLYDQFVIHHFTLSPNTLVLGGFGMTAALIYTMAYRLRPDDGITPLRLVLAFLLGGLFSTELAIFVEFGVSSVPVGSSANQNLLVHSLAGIVEEACKLLAVVIAARGLAVRTARTGLFLGGAVGLGFAAFEDMRYAVSALAGVVPGQNPLIAVIGVTLGRDAIGPLEHPLLSAFVASALFAATRSGRFRITTGVVGVYLIMSAVHGLIDTVPVLLTDSLGRGAGSVLGVVVDILIAVGLGFAWLVYTRRVNREQANGLRPRGQPAA